MKKIRTILCAAALVAAGTITVYVSAQKGADAPPEKHDAHDAKSHADCPLMRGDKHDAHMAEVNARGETAMGFSQTETAHHFTLTSDGGLIQVEVKDPADAANREHIRQHLSHVAQMFAAGDFSTPMLVHARNVPGTDAMSRLKAEIVYAYEETERGGRIRITTKSADALAAVQQFLRFQIEDHQTGDKQ